MGLFHEWTVRLRELRGKVKKYFHESHQEIMESNLHILQTLTFVTVGMLVLYLVMCSAMIRDWRVSGWHIAFLAVALVFCAAVYLYRKESSASRKGAMALCVGFQATVLAFSIILDVAVDPTRPGCFTPMLCIALSVSFILPIGLELGIVWSFGVTYAVIVGLVKTWDVGRYDMFCVVVGLLLATVISLVILSLRVQDHETRMHYMIRSTRDPMLISLLNKRSCLEQIRQYLKDTSPQVNCSMVFMDLDDFKQINDAYGHDVGDSVLRCTSEVLRSVFKVTDVIGRFGGDEFIILSPGLTEKDVLEKKCRLLCDTLCSYTMREQDISVTCSVGAVMVADQPADFKSLFKQVDEATYLSKGKGKGQYTVQMYRHPVPVE